MTPEDDAGFAGRIILVVDAALPSSAREACGDLVAALAERAGMPVAVAEVPIHVMDGVRTTVAQAEDARIREVAPSLRVVSTAPMSSAPFLWRDDGRPDWAGMWTTFCDLALYGGPPHRGPDRALRGPTRDDDANESDGEMIAEMRRGILETTGLYAEPARGWLAVTCESPTMAAWLCAAILLENVDARVEDDRLLLPAGPTYRLTDEVKSVITVVAKTHHYWRAHLSARGAGASPGA
jgi:sirohydrochlorin cobaltochelatase